ncbi:hypothetical protein JMJ56_21005 [Belnapia sp. T18]|uniref:Uncharacterized protein n=1 Tax=Belnapia arida TaxID=2804533 RepID=A0ABS1U987_9PROT|nr:hypothetical protein [Belnapia arida]MBL6080499.1 hypothetical protein [Belnapia arida]
MAAGKRRLPTGGASVSGAAISVNQGAYAVPNVVGREVVADLPAGDLRISRLRFDAALRQADLHDHAFPVQGASGSLLFVRGTVLPSDLD